MENGSGESRFRKLGGGAEIKIKIKEVRRGGSCGVLQERTLEVVLGGFRE